MPKNRYAYITDIYMQHYKMRCLCTHARIHFRHLKKEDYKCEQIEFLSPWIKEFFNIIKVGAIHQNARSTRVVVSHL
jgi:hypothetical protein